MTEFSVSSPERIQPPAPDIYYAIAAESEDGKSCVEEVWSRHPLTDHVAGYHEIIDGFHAPTTDMMPRSHVALRKDMIVPFSGMPDAYYYLRFGERYVQYYLVVRNQFGTKANMAVRGRIEDLELPLHAGDEILYSVQSQSSRDNLRTMLNTHELDTEELFEACRAAASVVGQSEVMDVSQNIPRLRHRR